MGCSKKNLDTGHCSTVNHVRLRKTPKHGEDAVAKSGTWGLCVSSLHEMEEGHSLAVLQSQQFQGGIGILETSPANIGISETLPANKA